VQVKTFFTLVILAIKELKVGNEFILSCCPWRHMGDKLFLLGRRHYLNASIRFLSLVLILNIHHNALLIWSCKTRVICMWLLIMINQSKIFNNSCPILSYLERLGTVTAASLILVMISDIPLLLIRNCLLGLGIHGNLPNLQRGLTRHFLKGCPEKPWAQSARRYCPKLHSSYT
jgi:hypothetical protein